MALIEGKLARRPDRALVADLTEHLGRTPRVLAWGSGPGGEALGLEDALAVHRDGHWEVIGWHLVLHGGWRPIGEELWWVLLDDQTGSIRLSEPGQLLDLFRERVSSTIAVQQQVETPNNGRAVISARRALGGQHDLRWHVLATGGTDLDDPQVREFLLEQTRQLQADYDL